MLTKRASRLLLAAALTVTAGTAVAVTGMTGATASTSPLPSLNAPGLHMRTAADPAPTAAGSCGYQASIPADRFKGVPVFNAAQAAQPFIVRFYTTQGVITVRMLTSKAPCTTFSFRFLASRGYFNQTHCHRLTVQGIFVLQCGDPTGTGSGGPGYKFANENLTGAKYTAGTVAMANAGPGTNGSQFFLVYRNSLTLPASYTPFGQIVSGLGIIQNVAKAGTDNSNGNGDGHPKEKVTIKSVTITKA